MKTALFKGNTGKLGWALLGFFGLVTAAWANPEVNGRVIRITDGDTIVVDTGQARLKVRLAEIDAPEVAHGPGRPGQPGGRGARAVLEKALAGMPVRMVLTGHSYDRVVAEVYLQNTWVNGGLVRAGWAWREPRYARDPRLADWEARARREHLGIWRLSGPETPPWIWRKKAWTN